MKKTRILLLASVVAALGAGGLAYASDSDDCNVPMAQWQTQDALRAMAEAKGWRVREIEIDDGCYEIEGYDRSGREIEVKIDPATLAIIEFEYEDDDYDDDDYHYDDDDDRDRYNNYDNSSAPAQPASPPNNGLFTSGSTPEVVVK